MITNQFFNPIYNKNEQLLLDNLIVESIKIMGINVYYIMKSPGTPDPIYGEDPSPSYEQTWLIEMYLEHYMHFEGDGDLVSKFAMAEIRDQVVFTISRRRFREDVKADTGFHRPREGDLIYNPLEERCYKIVYVDRYEMNYPLGSLYSWKITADLFEYSGEKFNTGIPDIDKIQLIASLNVLDYALLDVDGSPLKTVEGDYLVTDKFDPTTIAPLSDNKNIKDESEEKDYVDWSGPDEDPFNVDWVNPNTKTI